MASVPATIPTVVQLPKDPSWDLSAIDDRQTQLAIIARHQAKTIRVGYLVLLLFFGGLVGWAAYMPLSGAIVAMGEVRVEGNNKPVQHYGGGIVREIMVREGQLVQQGDTLLRLDKTSSEAQFEINKGHYVANLIQEARLLAERDGHPAIALPAELADRADDPEVAALIDAQRKVFEARRDNWTTQQKILVERITQLGEEMQGLRAQLTSVRQQLALINEEEADISYLVKQGFATKPRMLALQRQQASLIGQKGNIESGMARIEQRVTETNLQAQNQNERNFENIVNELKNVQNTLKDLRERKRMADAANQRMELRAPITGYVQNMQVDAVDQVVGSGQILMQIVPKDKPMRIQVKVKPDDIDEMMVGMKASVTLNIYNFRTFNKPIDGTVIAVAKDRNEPQNYQEMQQFGAGYYKATIELDPEQMAEYRRIDKIELFAGSPVTVIIPTEERTALEYFLAPLLQGVNKAFREA